MGSVILYREEDGQSCTDPNSNFVSAMIMPRSAACKSPGSAFPLSGKRGSTRHVSKAMTYGSFQRGKKSSEKTYVSRCYFVGCEGKRGDLGCIFSAILREMLPNQAGGCF